MLRKFCTSTPVPCTGRQTKKQHLPIRQPQQARSPSPLKRMPGTSGSNSSAVHRICRPTICYQCCGLWLKLWLSCQSCLALKNYFFFLGHTWQSRLWLFISVITSPIEIIFLLWLRFLQSPQTLSRHVLNKNVTSNEPLSTKQVQKHQHCVKKRPIRETRAHTRARASARTATGRACTIHKEIESDQETRQRQRDRGGQGERRGDLHRYLHCPCCHLRMSLFNKRNRKETRQLTFVPTLRPFFTALLARLPFPCCA
jgi:hypothetical protein